MEQENGENCVTRRYIICTRPNRVSMILLQRMRWVRYTRLEQMKNVYRISVTKPETKKAVGDLGVDGTRIFERKLINRVSGYIWIRLSRVDQMADRCEFGKDCRLPYQWFRMVKGWVTYRLEGAQCYTYSLSN
jgi:hypothetical protein